MRVVLFGSDGFIGSHIAAVLGGVELVTPEWPAVDITKPDTLRGLIEPGDIVVNAAGYANATDRTPQGRALFQSVNVDGVQNLARAAAESGAGQVVHVSSVAAMGRLSGVGITEEMRGPIASPYAQSKLDGETVLAEFANEIPVTILRPTSVFGEGRGLALTLCRLVSKRFVPLPLGGRALIPFTYVGNIAHAVRRSIGNPNCFGRTFIIGDRQSYSLRQIVLELGCAMGLAVRIIPIPETIALLGVLALEKVARGRSRGPIMDRVRLDTLTRSVSYSTRAFDEAVGFTQPFTFEQAINKIAQWYLAQHVNTE